MKWQKKLTKKELNHVKEFCGGTLTTFKQTRELQTKEPEACWECRFIAVKLGIEEVTK